MKKVAIIGSVGVPANYGGFETLVDYMLNFISSKFIVTVYCSSRHYPQKMKTYKKSRLCYISLKANGWQSIFYDAYCIIHSLFYADVLLILGVSGCFLLPVLRFCGIRRKIVVNIDGIEWKRAKWSKLEKMWLKFSERCAVLFADSVVCDNKVIQNYVKDTYHVENELIEYGSDHCTPIPLSKALLAKYPFLSEPYFLSVCRIEPENNLHLILKAFEKEKDRNLVMVGNWNNSNYGIQLKKYYHDFSNIHLLDPIYQLEDINGIRSNCYCYLHGHQCGGTNPSLLEAMHLGRLIFCFDVNFNRETTENKAIFFSSSEELREQIAKLNESMVAKIGNELFDISERRYRWSLISAKYEKLFNGRSIERFLFMTDKKNMLWIIFFLAIVLRFIEWQFGYIISRDGVFYLNMAKELSSGGDFSFLASRVARINHPPLIYFLLISFAKCHIPMELGFLILNIIISSIMVFPVYGIGVCCFKDDQTKYFFSPALGIALLVAIHPELVETSVAIQRESLFLFLGVLGIYWALVAYQKSGYWLWILVGACFGVSMLFRWEAVEFILGVSIFLLFDAIFHTKNVKKNAIFIAILLFSCFAVIYLLSVFGGFDEWLLLMFKSRILRIYQYNYFIGKFYGF